MCHRRVCVSLKRLHHKLLMLGQPLLLARTALRWNNRHCIWINQVGSNVWHIRSGNGVSRVQGFDHVKSRHIFTGTSGSRPALLNHIGLLGCGVDGVSWLMDRWCDNC